MNYCGIAECDVLNGTGFRTVLFVSGCEHHCPKCHNQKSWDYNFGHAFTEETEKYIYEWLDKDYIDGISITGGDPFAPGNINEVSALISRIRKKYGDSKTIWVWTGYTFDELQYIGAPLDDIDVVIDGRFEYEKRDVSLKWRGSSNQIIWRKTISQFGDIMWAREKNESKTD